MTLTAFLIAALVVTTPVTAELGRYLERSAEAEFTGEQLVACDTPDGDRSSVFNLAQHDGAVVAWDTDADVPIVGVAPGRSVTVTGETVEATVVEGNPVIDSDHYTVADQGEMTYLGRPATRVDLLRDGEKRVELTVDDATDAVMRTITYDDKGSLYCDRRMVSFAEDLSGVPDVTVDADADPLTPIEEEPEELPATIEGFELVDTYSLGDGTLSYYSDGFFSVGVAVTGRPITFSDSDEVVEVDEPNGRYQRVYQAGSVTVTWEAEAGNIVVIGDLPPDLLDAFLSDLPQPATGNFFDRIWSRLFG